MSVQLRSDNDLIKYLGVNLNISFALCIIFFTDKDKNIYIQILCIICKYLKKCFFSKYPCIGYKLLDLLTHMYMYVQEIIFSWERCRTSDNNRNQMKLRAQLEKICVLKIGDRKSTTSIICLIGSILPQTFSSGLFFSLHFSHELHYANVSLILTYRTLHTRLLPMYSTCTTQQWSLLWKWLRQLLGPASCSLATSL